MRFDRMSDMLRRQPLERSMLLLNGALSGLVALLCGVLGAVVFGSGMGPARVAVFAAAAALVVALAAVAHRRVAVVLLLEPLRQIGRAVEAAEAGELGDPVQMPDTANPEVSRIAMMLARLLSARRADRQRLRDVAARAFRAQEAERLRIARELQEETAQTLTTLLFRLRAARAADDASVRDAQLDEVRDDLVRTTDSIRGYARTLHPPSLKELGLVPALESYARALGARSGLHIQILGDGIQGLLPIEGELALYRVVQEALGNVVRHARATSVLVRVRGAGEYVKTLVEDDGAGFAVEATEARLPCLGLFGMRERALSVGGTVEIDSTPGDGTRVRISIPVVSNRAAAAAAWPVIVQSPVADAPDAAVPEGAAAERERRD